MGGAEAETCMSIADRFAQQAARQPERHAVGGRERPVTYGKLDALSTGHAEALLTRASPGARVALLLDDDVELLSAALAALRCGMSVLTLNPGDPPAHMAVVAQELEPEVVITTASHLEHTRAAGLGDVPYLDVSNMSQPSAGRAVELPRVHPDDTAFFIATSGSTGTPKLVLQSHRNVLHNVLRYTNGLGIRADDRLALLVALSGGQGLATAWTALLNGATLCPFRVAERGVGPLPTWIADNEITVFDTIPSVLRNVTRTLGERRMSSVRLVRLASEPAGRSDFDDFRDHFSPGCRMASVLASSECGIIAQALLGVDSVVGTGPLPVGLPAEGVDVALVDEDGEPVADGDVGEIVVRSAYLSPGYWRDAALTAERFEGENGERRFHSGDLARRNSEGMLEVVGRADRQVKIRGHRLQLESVERAMSSQPGVSAAAVVLGAAGHDGAKLTGFFTTSRGRTVSPASLRRSLRILLPSHAVPASLVELDCLPTNAHGKLDRTRLEGLVPLPANEERGDHSLTETEELLAGLWAESLGRERVAPDEPFLDLGGDSLDAATIAAGVDGLFGIELDLRVFAENPSARAMAGLIDSRRGSAAAGYTVPLKRVARPGWLSFSQERFWREEAAAGSRTHWNVTVPFAVHGPLDVGVLAASIDCLVQRHEILRTGYVEREGSVLAVVGAGEPTELRVDDLTAADAPEARVGEIVELERRRPFELASGRLLRWRLLRLGDGEHRLLRTSHHLIHDGVSWTIFMDELALVYEALLEGRPSPLGEPPDLQYIDYAAWERSAVRPQSRGHLEEVAFWERTLDRPPEPAPLPFARSRPLEEAERSDDVVRWGLPAERTRVLDAIGRAHGATYYMTRLAVFASLLALETDTDDLLIGTPISTRTRPELQRILGPFINFRQIRLHVDGDRPFLDLLAEVRRAVLATTANSAIPWERLTAELRSRGGELVRTSAAFAAWSSVEHVRFGGLEIESLPRPCGEARGFRLGVNRRYEADRCWADFDPRQFDALEVERFLGRLQQMVTEICARPEAPLRELHVLLEPAVDRAGAR